MPTIGCIFQHPGQQVMRSCVSGTRSACRPATGPSSVAHHVAPVGVAGRDHLRAHWMVGAGGLEVGRVERLVADRAIAAVLPCTHHRGGDVARAAPHRNAQRVVRTLRVRLRWLAHASAHSSARRRIRVCELDVQLLQALDHWSALAVADSATVDLAYRHHASERAGDEGLVGAVDIGQAEVALTRGDVGLARRSATRSRG